MKYCPLYYFYVAILLLLSSSSWWSSWLNSAKETSIAALTATKRDLSEFVTVLKEDTEAAVTGATTSIKGLLVCLIFPVSPLLLLI